MIHTVFNARPGSRQDRAKVIGKISIYIVKVSEVAFLFESAVAVELQNYASQILDAGNRWERNESDALERANNAYTTMLERVRRELGVVGSSRAEPTE